MTGQLIYGCIIGYKGDYSEFINKFVQLVHAQVTKEGVEIDTILFWFSNLLHVYLKIKQELKQENDCLKSMVCDIYSDLNKVIFVVMLDDSKRS